MAEGFGRRLQRLYRDSSALLLSSPHLAWANNTDIYQVLRGALPAEVPPDSILVLA